MQLKNLRPDLKRTMTKIFGIAIALFCHHRSFVLHDRGSRRTKVDCVYKEVFAFANHELMTVLVLKFVYMITFLQDKH